MLMYLIKANVVLVVLFGFYQLISGGDTFFKWRRLSLLSIYVLSLLLPTINLASVIDDGSPVANILPRIAYILPEVTVQPMPEAFDWQAVHDMDVCRCGPCVALAGVLADCYGMPIGLTQQTPNVVWYRGLRVGGRLQSLFLLPLDICKSRR